MMENLGLNSSQEEISELIHEVDEDGEWLSVMKRSISFRVVAKWQSGNLPLEVEDLLRVGRDRRKA